MSDTTDYQAISYVKASTYRQQILASLTESDYQTPADLARIHDIEIAHVSRALTELRNHGLVELLVDEDTKKGRLYGSTDKGETIAEKL